MGNILDKVLSVNRQNLFKDYQNINDLSDYVDTTVLEQDDRSECSITPENYKVLNTENIRYSQFLDPRSPSAVIDRTPICKESKEQVITAFNIEGDLRSPTYGIDRTPIIAKGFHDDVRINKATPLSIDLDSNEMVDPRSPTIGIDRTPIVIDGSISAYDSTPIVTSASGLSKSNHRTFIAEPNKNLFEEDHPSSSSSPFQTDETDQLASTIASMKNMALKNSTVVLDSVKARSSPIAAAAAVVRSPLTSRNYYQWNNDAGNPQALLQRKQANSVARLLMDKENRSDGGVVGGVVDNNCVANKENILA